jgi:hypothetical protein
MVRAFDRMGIDVTIPYREQVERAFCQQSIETPVPEIDSDGSEISRRACLSLADQRCARCGIPLCDEHAPPPDRRCDACESDYEQALAKAVEDAVLLTPTHRRIRTALCIALAGSGILMPWLTIEAILGSGAATGMLAAGAVLYALGLFFVWPVREDRLARHRLVRVREKFLREAAGTRPYR